MGSKQFIFRAELPLSSPLLGVEVPKEARRPHFSQGYQGLSYLAFCSSLPTPHPQRRVSGVGKHPLSIDLHQDPDGNPSGGGGLKIHEQRMGWGTGSGSGSGSGVQ